MEEEMENKASDYYKFTPEEEEELMVAYKESFDPKNLVYGGETIEEIKAFLDRLKTETGKETSQ